MADNDPAEQLKKLADLRAQGVLSEAEFTAAKQKVISDPPRPAPVNPPGAAKAAPAAPPKKSNKAGCGCLTVIAAVILVIVIVAVAGGSSSSGSSNAPASFTVSNRAVSKLVTNVINNNENSPGLARSPNINCLPNGSQCDINYTLKEPAGISAGLELVVPTAQIWKGLFEDSRFRSGLITVSGPLTTAGGKSITGAMFTLDCNRSDAEQIDWGNVDAHGIQDICTFDQLIRSL